MGDMNYFKASDFNLERLIQKKSNKRVIVVFSTFGEREADLIFDKISLLKEEFQDFVDLFFLSHRRAGTTEERTEVRAREADSDLVLINCNTFEVPDMGNERGKGADMRRTLYAINKQYMGNKSSEDTIVVFLDADVVPEYFGTHFVTGLAGAVLDGNEFAKASFWRAMGRVKKYVAQPLFSAIDHPDLNGLRDLSYPLSGEVAGTLSFFNSVPFWQMYGVETGINIDALYGNFSIADVNLGLYDHEHHGDVGIQKMAFGIIRTYLKQLQDHGILELKGGAKISDLFCASFINEEGERERIEADLKELKYTPLAGVLS